MASSTIWPTQEEEKIPSLRKPKTDPRLSMPGYEVYGEVKQIMSLWRLILASLISLLLGVGAWIVVPHSYLDVAFFYSFIICTQMFFAFSILIIRRPAS